MFSQQLQFSWDQVKVGTLQRKQACISSLGCTFLICSISAAKSVIFLHLMPAFDTLRVFYSVNATCNKAAVMKPRSAVASSSSDASSSSPWSLVFLLSLRMTAEGEDGGRSGIQTSEAILLTAVCPSVWTQVRCEIRPALQPPTSPTSRIFYMCHCVNPHTLCAYTCLAWFQKFCKNRDAKAAICDVLWDLDLSSQKT